MSTEQNEEQAYTVTQAMNAAKRGLEQISVTVIGEISEFTDKYKMIYFTVRDDAAAMSCTMWSGAYRKCGLALRQGMLVQVTGHFTCYPAKGRMQFSVSKVVVAGEGNLRMQVAQLARKLEAEGLMDASRKRRTPALPQRIAVITSPRGKAVHDVLRTLRRRYPLAEVLLFGVTVEGDSAPAVMREALAAANSSASMPDVILLVRGGGSYEDLMPFNDEGLARAVAASSVPVVTGIGHEPDNSIADMVADRRCSTPTAAAEAVAPSIDDLRAKLANATRALGSALDAYNANLRSQLVHLADRALWHDPQYLTAQRYQALDSLQQRMQTAAPNATSRHTAALDALATHLELVGAQVAVAHGQQLAAYAARLHRAIPDALNADSHRLALAAERLRAVGSTLGSAQVRECERQAERLKAAGPALLRTHTRRVALAAAKLDALSPLKTLSRGYSITYASDGTTVVDSVSKTAPGETIGVQLQDGTVHATVETVERR